MYYYQVKEIKKNAQNNKVKSSNSLETSEYGNQQNYSCNKDMFLYNKDNGFKLNNSNQYNNSNKYNNSNVYFSPKKLGFKQKNNNSIKEFENVDLNNKNFIYQKKTNNNTFNSPLNNKNKIEKKYFSYKKLNCNDIDNN